MKTNNLVEILIEIKKNEKCRRNEEKIYLLKLNEELSKLDINEKITFNFNSGYFKFKRKYEERLNLNKTTLDIFIIEDIENFLNIKLNKLLNYIIQERNIQDKFLDKKVKKYNEIQILLCDYDRDKEIIKLNEKIIEKYKESIFDMLDILYFF